MGSSFITYVNNFLLSLNVNKVWSSFITTHSLAMLGHVTCNEPGLVWFYDVPLSVREAIYITRVFLAPYLHQKNKYINK